MRFRIALLTALVALLIVGMASADEEPTGTWYTRWFTGSAKSEAEPAKKDADKSTLPAAPKVSNLERLRRAKATWVRRMQVCQALREIADNRDDEELRRKVEMLESRAWDAYTASTPFSNRASSEASIKSAGSPSKNSKEAN